MNRIPESNRPLVVVAMAVVVLVLVAVGVLLVGQLGPSPAPPTSLPPTATAAPSVDASTPEGATRAFFDAVVAARRTNNPELIEPFVTSRDSSAYLTVAGFLAGQQEAGKASITTLHDLTDINVEQTGDSARLTASLLEAGYDIDLDTGQPLESPVTLDPRRLTVELRRTAGVWKVESFETGAAP
ncbi:MAG: hypothetical protein FIA92_07195 [Chloroflexi bacterium]|nr:hypothetical protein [Chloroflexota bacterium]